jgi:hypothetical protein
MPVGRRTLKSMNATPIWTLLAVFVLAAFGALAFDRPFFGNCYRLREEHFETTELSGARRGELKLAGNRGWGLAAQTTRLAEGNVRTMTTTLSNNTCGTAMAQSSRFAVRLRRPRALATSSAAIGLATAAIAVGSLVAVAAPASAAPNPNGVAVVPPPPPPNGVAVVPPPPPPNGVAVVPPPPPPNGVAVVPPPPPPNGVAVVPPPPPRNGVAVVPPPHLRNCYGPGLRWGCPGGPEPEAMRPKMPKG